MIIGRIIGWILLLAAAVVLLRDLIAWFDTGGLAPIAAGQVWGDIHRSSLALVQSGIERSVAPWLWDPVLAAILSWWAVPVLAIPGLLFLRAFRARRGRRRRRR